MRALEQEHQMCLESTRSNSTRMGAEQTLTRDLRCKAAKDDRVITDLQTEINNVVAVAREEKSTTRENLRRATDDRTANLKREVKNLEAQNAKLQHGIQGWKSTVADCQKQIESEKQRRVKEQRQYDEVEAIMHSLMRQNDRLKLQQLHSRGAENCDDMQGYDGHDATGACAYDATSKQVDATYEEAGRKLKEWTQGSKATSNTLLYIHQPPRESEQQRSMREENEKWDRSNYSDPNLRSAAAASAILDLPSNGAPLGSTSPPTTPPSPPSFPNALSLSSSAPTSTTTGAALTSAASKDPSDAPAKRSVGRPKGSKTNKHQKLIIDMTEGDGLKQVEKLNVSSPAPAMVKTETGRRTMPTRKAKESRKEENVDETL